ncbi:right-handed parallel beta-helix repeat-containing protein, partial [uncultured Methanobrevibacter sp.]|uniref:right-handed parallel beta-helix repeat-containing protein n=1 Tax=uncultured Methanobrevibacter sp. TaxID=253161 RepID=UPI0034CF491F
MSWTGTNGTLSDSIFINNSANRGGCIYWNSGAINGTLIGSTFISNSASYGSGIYFRESNCILTDCKFSNNHGSLGTIYFSTGNYDMNACIFINNSATNGAALNCDDGTRVTISNCIFINNSATKQGGGINCRYGTLIITDCIFINNSAAKQGGGICFTNLLNAYIYNSTFSGNSAEQGGAVYFWCISDILDCNFTDNHAIYGDNVYWRYSAYNFLEKYNQINDYDYVFIYESRGTPAVGKPLNNIILNKKGVTIHGQSTNITFDARGKNLHFEVTGDNVLIEGITFRNFNFTNGSGGAILW